MKIKVGDWVKVNNKGIVGKVTLVKPNKYIEYYGNKMLKNVVFLNNQTVKNYETELTKLHINFKPFEIIFSGEEVYQYIHEVRVLPNHQGTITFRAIKLYGDGDCEVVYFTDGHTKTTCPSICTTIDQARDWLELQYATLLAKARWFV